MKRSVLVLALLMVSGVARAETMTTVRLSEQELEQGLHGLAVQLDEPIGMRAVTDLPKLGLVRGDIVIAIDGHRALGVAYGLLPGDQPVIYLDVRRGTRDLVVRVKVQLGPIEHHDRRDEFQHAVARQREFTDEAFSPVTRAGRPSGVLVRLPLPMELPLEEDDLVRRVDGKPVTTGAELLAALDAAKADAKVRIDLERLGQPVEVTLVLEDPPKEEIEVATLKAKIKQIDATTYEVPKGLLAAIVTNPMAAARDVRVVPAFKDGKPQGFKLYAIRPGSLAAMLGFANGDTLAAIDGQSLDSIDKMLDAFAKLPGAPSVVIVEVVRRGKRMSLEYRIR